MLHEIIGICKIHGVRHPGGTQCSKQDDPLPKSNDGAIRQTAQSEEK